MADNRFLKIFMPLFILFAVTVFIFSGNRANYFATVDDYGEIIANPLVNPGKSSLKMIFTDLSTFHFYVPLKHASNYLLNKAAPYDPHVSHLFNDFIHLLTVFLVFFTVGFITKSPRIAFLTALFFAVCPVNSNAVNEISAKGHLFTGFFALLSFLFYLLADTAKNRIVSFILRAGSVLVYFAGMLAWPVVIMLPCVIFIYELVKKEKISIKQLFFRLLMPFAITATIILTLNFYIVRIPDASLNNTFVFESSRSSNDVILGAELEPFYKVLGSSSFYMLPSIAADYIIYTFKTPFFDSAAFSVTTQGALRYIFNIFVVFSYIFISVLIYRKNKNYIIGPAVFVFFLLPGILFLYPSNMLNLRYMYLPSAGIFFTVFAFAQEYIFSKIRKDWQKYAVWLLLGLWLTVFAVNSYTRKNLWYNRYTVVNSTIETGGYSAVWGWNIKAELSPDYKQKLIYLKNAQNRLMEMKPSGKPYYAATKKYLSGSIERIEKNLR